MKEIKKENELNFEELIEELEDKEEFYSFNGCGANICAENYQ